jgi:16S rRNA (cytosine967-C5)-methyltransferase
VLARCVDRPWEQVDAPVRDVLRLGAHQLLADLRVPPHAAVSTTVDLAREMVGPRVSGFVNAVLRRVAAHTGDDWDARLGAEAPDPVARLAVLHSHPEWIVREYADLLPDVAEVEAALHAGNERPGVHLVVRPGLDREALAAEIGAMAGPWSPYSLLLPGGAPARLPAVVRGDVRVQDEGSQLVALAVARAPLEPPDATWLDLCAGPGGKSWLLAALARPTGARLVATEPAQARAGLVAEALAQLPNALTIRADGRVPAWRPHRFDRVLVDAPCTGLGALRRRPEARWRKQPSDLPGLRALQAALLDSALGAVRPGGVVGYATCSPLRAETTEIVAAALDAHADLEQLDARDLLPGVPSLGPGPHVQLWPHIHGTDAMFLAVLRRRA